MLMLRVLGTPAPLTIGGQLSGLAQAAIQEPVSTYSFIPVVMYYAGLPKPRYALLSQRSRYGSTSVQWFGPSPCDYAWVPMCRAARQQEEFSDENHKCNRIVRFCTQDG